MGSLVSALGPVLQVGSALGTVASVAATVHQKRPEPKSRKRLRVNKKFRLSRKMFPCKKSKIAWPRLQAEDTRRLALKRAMSRQRGPVRSQRNRRPVRIFRGRSARPVSRVGCRAHSA
jgi:hypothetical protein